MTTPQPSESAEPLRAEDLGVADAGGSAAPDTPTPILVLALAGGVVLFALGAWRHHMQHSTAFDLGFYDQIAYLLSRGQAPVSSFLAFHFLGDHVALVMYPVSLLYRIHPSVLWLLAAQAAALGAGVVLTWKLARAHGVGDPTASALAAAYLLYPEIFNVDLFDFHPDALAVPGFLWALWAAKAKRPVAFTAAIVWVMACKAPFSLTVAAMGVWLLLFERRRMLGAVASVLGAAWFLVATQVVIPHFSGGEAIGVARFSYLGDSVLGVLANTVLRPDLVAARVFSVPTLVYLGILGVVFVWWVAPRRLGVVVAMLPTLAMNILGVDPKQRTLAYQYSLPILPFLLWAVAASLAGRDRTLASLVTTSPKRRARIPVAVVVWAAVTLLWLGRWDIAAAHLRRPPTWDATRTAVALIPADASVLTDNRLAPQLTHRAFVKLLDPDTATVPDSADYVLLDLTEPWPDTRDSGRVLDRLLDRDDLFERVFDSAGVRLYRRRARTSPLATSSAPADATSRPRQSPSAPSMSANARRAPAPPTTAPVSTSMA